MIQITESAITRMKEMLAQEDNEKQQFVRFGVKYGGCSGLTYGLGFDDNMQTGDTIIETNGVQLVVDAESYPYLDGVEIDFVETGMMGGFTIQNPNARVTCGCGSSFRTALDRGKKEKCD
ncbi:iron-sulfur cluster assembly accessory protein [uncultured Brevibacillus sp.]|uniref:HesB/IscA family protein n=1 Tax=uncultured Brevibacillus sp. TaxID=169970 RepID=UPI0025963F06|nr:iron-sulfur cluster assembly accessory protein [uncultured Brevibacillus sp.]